MKQVATRQMTAPEFNARMRCRANRLQSHLMRIDKRSSPTPVPTLMIQEGAREEAECRELQLDVVDKLKVVLIGEITDRDFALTADELVFLNQLLCLLYLKLLHSLVDNVAEYRLARDLV